jgi:regulator of sirC expression with transglutaminase-like and TPR domain
LKPNRESLRRFAESVARPEPEIDLAEAALLMAADEYDGLDVAPYLARLDALARKADAEIPRRFSPRDRAWALSQFLFVRQGFAGDRADYYDPRNSHLNEVLDRKLGLPITLAVVLMAVGRRMDPPVAIHGIGMPAHFVARWGEPPGEVFFIDAFHRGEPLTERECAALIESQWGQELPVPPSAVPPSGPRLILRRILSNLRGAHLLRKDPESAIRAVERLVALDPGSAGDVQDLAALCRFVGRNDEAVGWLERYLQVAPDSPDAALVAVHLRKLRDVEGDGEGEGNGEG